MKKFIVILHGWGLTGSRYSELINLLQHKGYSVLAPDLPGFGSQKLNEKIVNLQSYLDFVSEYFITNEITKAIIIGHSFGGRIAAKFTAKNPKQVEKLILTGAPLILQPLSIRKKIIVGVGKLLKNFLLFLHLDYQKMRKIIYFLLGEWDYYRADGMREIFCNIIEEDLSHNLPFIRVPTLVIWGDNDNFVSKKIGRKIAKLIPGSLYVEVPNGTHRLPYENPNLFAKEVLKFIQ